jgi:hypothetical protein
MRVNKQHGIVKSTMGSLATPSIKLSIFFNVLHFDQPICKPYLQIDPILENWEYLSRG